MNNITRHYRTDSTTGLDPSIITYLDSVIRDKLAYFDTPNPKVVVVFSGGNGVGKTTLATRISHELHGLLIENDAIKRALIAHDPTLDKDQRNVMTWQYTMHLYAQLPRHTPNGLVVRDGVIDWYFDRILPLFTEQGYRLFIIGYDLSREKRAELITQRGDTPTTTAQRLLDIMEEHEPHVARFRAQYAPTISIDETNLFDHDRVIARLTRFLKES